MTIAVVTGAASGIGAAVCRQYRAAGFEVIGVDLQGVEIDADLSTKAGRQGAVDAVLRDTGGCLDRLVCCAGLGPQAEPASLIAAVNYFGATAMLDGLFPALQRGRQPAAVVVSSIAAVQQASAGTPLCDAYLSNDEERVQSALAALPQDQAGYAAYASSKHAVTLATRLRAATWGSAGVRLNAVAPGAVQTPLLEAGLTDPRYAEAIRNYVAPLGRRAQADEVAALISFVSGETAAFIHGSVLFIDGGMDAQVRPMNF
ncbi:SDR family oxidoreductase [Cupriavidus basilensis]